MGYKEGATSPMDEVTFLANPNRYTQIIEDQLIKSFIRIEKDNRQSKSTEEFVQQLRKKQM